MITDDHIRAYRDQGWFVLEDALDTGSLEVLRRECQRFMDERDAEMDAAGTDVIGLDRRGQRYFVNDCSTRSHSLRQLLLGEAMREVCRATIGQEAYLFNDQFVVKGTDGETSFSWHQDGGYIPYEHLQYVTCWIALDDVDETNGWLGISATTPVCPRSSTPAASFAFRAPCSIAAARTRLIACAASTWLSTPPSRSSMTMAMRRGTRPCRCCAPVGPPADGALRSGAGVE